MADPSFDLNFWRTREGIANVLNQNKVYFQYAQRSISLFLS